MYIFHINFKLVPKIFIVHENSAIGSRYKKSGQSRQVAVIVVDVVVVKSDENKASGNTLTFN